MKRKFMVILNKDSKESVVIEAEEAERKNDFLFFWIGAQCVAFFNINTIGGFFPM